MAPRSLKWAAAPSRRPNAPEVLPAHWEERRGLLKGLYINQGMTLEGVMNFMDVQHGFSPTYVNFTLLLSESVGILAHAV
jgi:hypothetical protein